MLYNSKELSEINYMKHRHDDNKNFVDYENKLLDKTLAPYIFQNSMMNSFLKKLQPLLAIMFDQVNIMKNWKNYMVDKYEYRNK